MESNKLNEFKEKIDKELELFFDEKINSDGKISKEIKEALEILKDYTLRGGKRLRAAIMYHAYRCFRDNKEKEMLKASMAMELMQSYFLIHDDIMDRDELRRGSATIHKKYEEIYKDVKDKEHLGLAMAVMAGDIASTFAFEILTKADFDEISKIKSLKILEEKELNTIYGQILDVFSFIKEVDEEYIEKIHKFKSTSYTAYIPLQIGATLANASNKDIEILTEFGDYLGKIFQIGDDLLDLFSDKTGKDIASDIKEGKKTIFILKALEKANDEEKEFIENCLGNEKLTEEDINKLREIIKNTSSLDYTKNLQKNMAEKAKNILEKADFKEEGKAFLLELIDFLLERDV